MAWLAATNSLPPPTAGIDRGVERAGLDPHWTEVAGGTSGFYRPQEAILALARRGAVRIAIARAILDDRQVPHVDARRARLTG